MVDASVQKGSEFKPVLGIVPGSTLKRDGHSTVCEHCLIRHFPLHCLQSRKKTGARCWEACTASGLHSLPRMNPHTSCKGEVHRCSELNIREDRWASRALFWGSATRLYHTHTCTHTQIHTCTHIHTQRRRASSPYLGWPQLWCMCGE